MKLTIKDVYDAIEKNGLPWHHKDFYLVEGGEIVAACAIGQAAYNLNVEAISLHRALNNVKAATAYMYIFLATEIEEFNDSTAEVYEEVVKFSKDILEPYFDVEIEVVVE